MKLVAKPRAVRIRIESGGMEHSSLESLKGNFELKAVADALDDGRLETWLKQIGEDEFVKQIEPYKGKLNAEDMKKKFCEVFGVEYDYVALNKKWTEKRTDWDFYENKLKICRDLHKDDSKATVEIDLMIAKGKIHSGDKDEALKILAKIKDSSAEAMTIYKELRPLPKENFTINVNGYDVEMIYVKGSLFDSYLGVTRNMEDYFIGKYPVTVGLWRAVMGSVPRGLEDCVIGRPITDVQWNDALMFIKKLSDITGYTFSMPNDFQWEYAARGGINDAKTKYSGSDWAEFIICTSTSRGKISPVGSSSGNILDIYDMSGNVWEMCENVKDNKSKYVLRGGAYDCYSHYCVVGYREKPSSSNHNVGFRLCIAEGQSVENKETGFFDKIKSINDCPQNTDF